MASQNGPGIARESESEVSGALIGRLIRRLMPFLLLSLGRLGLSGGGTDPRATGATDRSPAPVRS
ncbi:hypothetical protein C7446_1877 [Kushneria sinocarnis]|uniref:Uncharacterized protein n=1 Tax=Kushneria sinocarnis TaxID=595502 RepID=A0A420WW51_9GAMM|nr:hypothetical protein [Kushneria sinocarnis]RKR03356.1 hypothetical protein C7446_1877 [Kushneria sinocarnis]